jgi:exo-beta-1,3-glucanase (GH17 family)
MSQSTKGLPLLQPLSARLLLSDLNSERTWRPSGLTNISAGYTGPVVAVDTFIAILNNPSLCQASDYIAANAHAYFDGTVAAAGAGAWVAQQAQKLGALCAGKGVLITGISYPISLLMAESGWPSAGDSNGAAVASPGNQATAKSSILSTMSNKCVLFSAFDDAWKAPGQYGIEQYWVLFHLTQTNRSGIPISRSSVGLCSPSVNSSSIQPLLIL